MSYILEMDTRCAICVYCNTLVKGSLRIDFGINPYRKQMKGEFVCPRCGNWQTIHHRDLFLPYHASKKKQVY